MSSKFLNLSTDNTLGGNSPSDTKAVAEKAIKEYVDNSQTKLTAISGYYGTCSTTATTQAKVVVCPDFALETGASIRVKFTNAQTYNGQPTLNVNSTGAKNVTLRGTTAGIRYMWAAGEVVDFTYDGTNWIWERGGTATTTYYGVTKLATSATSTSTSFALTPASLNNLVLNMIEPYPTYSSSSTYAVGDRVRYNYQAWECTTPITTEEAWTESHWRALDPIQTQIDSKVDELSTKPTAGTYTKVTINGEGQVTAGAGLTASDIPDLSSTYYLASNPAGYTSNTGTVTSVNNIQPVNGNVTISIPSEVTEATVSGWGFTKNTGTVTSVNNVQPVNGNVTLSIPTVNNATLTIQSNGTTVGTFTANSSSNVTANISSTQVIWRTYS